MAKADIRVARIYEPPDAADGTRILVDRLWPRGLRKVDAHIDEWCKDIAPSTELRSWYQHDPDHFKEFGTRYRRELRSTEAQETLERLHGLATTGRITLLTASKAVDISQAVVLRDVIAESGRANR